ELERQGIKVADLRQGRVGEVGSLKSTPQIGIAAAVHGNSVNNRIRTAAAEVLCPGDSTAAVQFERQGIKVAADHCQRRGSEVARKVSSQIDCPKSVYSDVHDHHRPRSATAKVLSPSNGATAVQFESKSGLRANHGQGRGSEVA